ETRWHCSTRQIHAWSHTTRIFARNAALGCSRRVGQNISTNAAFVTAGRVTPAATDSRPRSFFRKYRKPRLSATRRKRRRLLEKSGFRRGGGAPPRMILE